MNLTLGIKGLNKRNNEANKLFVLDTEANTTQQLTYMYHYLQLHNTTQLFTIPQHRSSLFHNTALHYSTTQPTCTGSWREVACVWQK